MYQLKGCVFLLLYMDGVIKGKRAPDPDGVRQMLGLNKTVG